MTQRLVSYLLSMFMKSFPTSCYYMYRRLWIFSSANGMDTHEASSYHYHQIYSCYRFQKHTFDSSVMNGFGWCRNNLSRSKKILTRRAHHWWMHLNSSVFHRALTFLHCLIDDRFVLFSSSLLMPTPLHFKAQSKFGQESSIPIGWEEILAQHHFRWMLLSFTF
jgi:hypothetical protein